MKKFGPLIYILLATLLLAWSAYATVRPAPQALRLPAQALASPTDTTAAALLRVAALERSVEALARQQDQAGLALARIDPIATGAGLPEPAIAPGQYGAASGTAPARRAAPPAPAISMVYLSPGMERVVIDGQLLATGDLLPGGARIVSISQDRVVTQRKGRKAVVLRAPEGQVLGTVSAGARKDTLR